jgi:hypothetical protein
MRSMNCSRIYRGGLFIFLLAGSMGLAPREGRVSAQETEPPKPYLGFVVEQPTDSSGVVVVDLDPKGPVGLAGIKSKDVIESIDGVAITSMADMSTAMKGKNVGSKLKFVVKREGKSVSADVTLAAAPSGAPAGGVPVEKVPPKEGDEPAPLPDPDAGAPRAPLSSGPAKPYLGLTVVPHARGGAAISSIRKDSPAAKIGFPLGGVIIRVNDTPVENPDDLINFIAAMAPGSTIELSYMHNERLYRKQVKLSSIGGGADRTEPEVISPPAAPLPGDIPILRDPPVREDRPILNGIGRALGGAPLGGIGGGEAALARQLEDLRAIVQSLEERIVKLEGELAALKTGGKPEETPAPPAAPSP